MTYLKRMLPTLFSLLKQIENQYSEIKLDYSDEFQYTFQFIRLGRLKIAGGSAAELKIRFSVENSPEGVIKTYYACNYDKKGFLLIFCSLSVGLFLSFIIMSRGLYFPSLVNPSSFDIDSLFRFVLFLSVSGSIAICAAGVFIGSFFFYIYYKLTKIRNDLFASLSSRLNILFQKEKYL